MKDSSYIILTLAILLCSNDQYPYESFEEIATDEKRINIFLKVCSANVYSKRIH